MIVLLHEGHVEFLLSDVKYAEDGSIKSGYVENGCWNYLVKGGEELAKDGRFIVNRWPKREYSIVDVPSSIKGDYNAIMCWAEEQHTETAQ